MTSFEDRERAFEAKYAHDEHFRFRMIARRDKVFANWAADQVGLGDEDRAALVADAIAVHDRAGHDDRLIELIRRRILIHGGHADRAGLTLALQQAADQARRELVEHASPLLG